MIGIEVDSKLFPVIQVINHGGKTDEGYHHLFRELEVVMQRGDKFVVLTEARGDVFPSATQRKLVTDWFPKVAAPMRRTSLGCAMVMNSAMQRGAITALNWVFRPGVPMAAFEEREPALAWCHERLVAAGVAIPPHVARALRAA